jgi:glycosyltransferase involved in cell wall biosynthesis
MLKVLIVSQYFWPESFGINDVAESLVKSGCDITILTGPPNYPDGSVYPSYSAFALRIQVKGEIKICRVPAVPRGKDSAIRLALNYISFVISGAVFGTWLLRNKKFDVIFVYAPSPILQGIPAIFLGWLKQFPVAIWVQDLWPQSLSATGYIQNRCILRAVEKIVQFIYRHADLLLVQSRAFIEPVRRLAPETSIKYYPNSVDASYARPSTYADTTQVPWLDAPFTVMFAGNIGFAQAVDVIRDVAILLKEYKDIHFIVLGDGSRREWMLEQATKHGLVNLHLPGRFPVESMPSLMQKASALLVTLADQPIFCLTIPNKVQAYLAAGRPILASLNGEGAELVKEAKAGLTVPAEDSQALADAVLKLYSMSRDERDALGAHGRAYYKQHFTHEVLIDQLIDLLQAVRKRKKGGK